MFRKNNGVESWFTFKNSDSETTKLDIDVQSPDEETGIQGGYYILLRDGG